jgi:Transglycosylase SLT domain
MNEGLHRYSEIKIEPIEKESSNTEDVLKDVDRKVGKGPKISRRDFLKATGILGSALVVDQIFNTPEEEPKKEEVPEVSQKSNETIEVPEEAPPEVASKEKVPMLFTPLEQILLYGEVRDLSEGLQVYQNAHFESLVKTKEGLRDLEITTNNLKKFNIDDLTKPFEENNLPRELAYMIPVQETRGKNVVSPAGARGISGIMPNMIKAFGFKKEHVEDPYIASEITAKYLAEEREKRFGEKSDVDMLLYAYNAGGGLFGFTKTVPKEERTCENFFQYMEGYMNAVCKKIHEKKYTHILDEKDKTLSHVSNRFGIPLARILEANGFTKDTVIHKGDSVLIPFENMKEAAKIVFRNPLEALQYAPEIKAKFKALKESGLLYQVDARAKTEESVLV